MWMGLDLAPQLWDVFLHGCMALYCLLPSGTCSSELMNEVPVEALFA
jgi:hypothetical protein